MTDTFQAVLSWSVYNISKNILKASYFNKQFLHPFFINMFLKEEQKINSVSQIIKKG